MDWKKWFNVYAYLGISFPPLQVIGLLDVFSPAKSFEEFNDV